MKNLALILLGHLGLIVSAQQTISGSVTDHKGNPVMYANIYFEGSYDGTITDSTGTFSFITDLSGRQLLVASCIGYEKYSGELDLSTLQRNLRLTLEESVSEINEVSITAGVFSASDKKKSATLTSFDIATTASAMGDIYGAYATMPGSQKVGEEGLLFVRGGEGYETKTYMDGMLVQSPYFSSMPDVPTRGRFSPLLFSETVFSTGGYSAEYGDALSSIVDLTTNGLETEDKVSFGLMTVGANASFAKRWENSSLAVTGLYANNVLHHKMFRQNVDWTKDPVLLDGMVMFRQKVGKTGLLKSFLSLNSNEVAMNYDNFQLGTMENIHLINRTAYTGTTYSDQINEHWLVRMGLAYNGDLENLTFNSMPVETTNTATTAKLVLTHLTSDKVKIRFGGDLIRESYEKVVTLDSTFSNRMNDLQPSLFVESDLNISGKVAVKLGLRSEYSSQLREGSVVPRISAAYKTGEFSQVSLAWGKFRQKPQDEYLMFAPGLNTEKADHYILNFQYRKERRIFRIESYIKKYDDLVKFGELYNTDPSNYNNNGEGFARGIDIFWRDQKTLKGADYWISYSYLKTARDYKDYPESTVPSFASAHNLSLVYKQFISPLSTYAGITYSFASGRPFDDKNSPEFMAGRTGSYNDISMNLTYVTRVFGQDCIIHMNVTNLFGFKNIFGYQFSDTPGEDGLYASKPIVPTSGRQAILLIMISL